MTACVGIELGERTLRGVRLVRGHRPAQVVELDWNGESPRDAVETLRERLGPARRIAVALDLPLLFVKRVKLPPLEPAEKERILRLEPERFFAVRGEDVVAAARREDDLVFAAHEAPLTEWIAALETLAPVDIIEPGPAALARALERAGVSDAAVLLDLSGDGAGLVLLRRGRMALARRVFGGLGAAAIALHGEADPPPKIYLCPWSDDRAATVASSLPNATPEPLPEVAGVASAFLSAFGAALAIDGSADTTGGLVPAELAARISARRRRDVAVAALACAAALVFAVTSADAWRARALRTLETGLPALHERAAPAVALQGEIGALEREAQAIRGIALERPDPLPVLAALSNGLPAGAYLRTVRATGADWQIDGYAPNAAQLLAQVARTPGFQNVRFLAATTRVTLGNRTYESFALAFRFAAAP